MAGLHVGPRAALFIAVAGSLAGGRVGLGQVKVAKVPSGAVDVTFDAGGSACGGSLKAGNTAIIGSGKAWAKGGILPEVHTSENS
jgi:hypothetical protein